MANDSLSTITKVKDFPVEGMSCAACAVAVEKALSKEAGVNSANVNYATNSVRVVYEDVLPDPQVLDAALRRIGYGLILTDDPGELRARLEKKRRALRFKTIFSIALALPVMVISMGWMHSETVMWVSFFLSIPVMIVGGSEFFVKAWEQLKNRTANMDTLVAMGTGAAFLFSAVNLITPEIWGDPSMMTHVYFESAVVVIALVLLGRFFEDRAKEGTTEAVRALIRLRPKTALRIENGHESEVLVSVLQIGDLLRIRPGGQIPVDGKVREGHSWVDESMLTGESEPIHKEAGDLVAAGTVNGKGSFVLEAKKVGEATMLSEIIRLVQQAQGSNSPSQRLADKVASVFVPAVIGMAMLTAVLWAIFGPAPAISHAIMSAVTVLVIACPCALGLATPTAVMVGVGRAARAGLLVQDAASLEGMRDVDVVVLDKTGTITEGRPVVVAQHWSGDLEPDRQRELLAAVMALEKQSEHPLAAAIVRWLEDSGVKAVSVVDFAAVAGKGAHAQMETERFWVGNAAMAHEMGVDGLERIPAASAGSTVYFGWEGLLAGAFQLRDKVRDGAAAAIRRIVDEGVEVHMLTGDSELAARPVAQEVGITVFRAGVLPQGKIAYIRGLQQKGLCVAMVGDGINDAPALAQSDAGIAMGGGTDVALGAADAVVIGNRLEGIAELIGISRATVRTIRENLFWAFIYNVVALPVAAGILFPFTGYLLDPMIAGAAMAFSSVSVVLNSLRLRTRGF